MTSAVHAQTVTCYPEWTTPDQQIQAGDVVVRTTDGQLKSRLTRQKDTIAWYIGICAQGVAFPERCFAPIVNGIVLVTNYSSSDIPVFQAVQYSPPNPEGVQLKTNLKPYKPVKLTDYQMTELRSVNPGPIQQKLQWSMKHDDPCVLSLDLIWRYCLAYFSWPNTNLNLTLAQETHYENLYYLVNFRFDSLLQARDASHRQKIMYLVFNPEHLEKSSASIFEQATREFHSCIHSVSIAKLREITLTQYRVPGKFLPPHVQIGSIIPRESLIKVSERLGGVALTSAKPQESFVLSQSPHFRQVFRF